MQSEINTISGVAWKLFTDYTDTKAATGTSERTLHILFFCKKVKKKKSKKNIAHSLHCYVHGGRRGFKWEDKL